VKYENASEADGKDHSSPIKKMIVNELPTRQWNQTGKEFAIISIASDDKLTTADKDCAKL